MKTILAILFGLWAAGSLAAPAPYPVTINSRAATAPLIEAYRASARTYRLSFTDGGAATDLSGCSAFMSWATSNTAVSCVTGSAAVISATGGIVDVTFTAAQLNYAPGRYIYEAGISSGGVVTVVRQGVLLITGSPYGSGVQVATFGTNLNFGAYQLVGIVPTGNLDMASLDARYSGALGEGFPAWSNTWHQRVVASVTNAGSEGGGLYAMSNKTWVSFSAGGVPLNWANYPAVGTVDMDGHDITNVHTIFSTSGGGVLTEPGLIPSVDWGGRKLYVGGGATYSLDWDNRQLLGAWTLGGNTILTNEPGFAAWSNAWHSRVAASVTNGQAGVNFGSLTVSGNQVLTNEVGQAVWAWALPLTNWGVKMRTAAYISQAWGKTVSGVVTAQVYRQYFTNAWASGVTLLGSVVIGTTGANTTAGWNVGADELLGVYFDGGQTQQCVFGLTYSY